MPPSFQQILATRPADSADLLETLLLAKKTAYEHGGGPIALPEGEAVKPLEEAQKLSELFLAAEPPINPETGEAEPVDPPNEFETEDLMSGAALLESIGCGLGMKEMYNVMLALKSLGEDPSAKVATVRFFGKFFGISANYYVFETTLKEPNAGSEEAESVVPAEIGTGTNGFVYFVTTNLGDPCIKLPDITPQQIKDSRYIKKYLTGDLTAEVSAYPTFPGKEAVYLRAQIARIAATTTLCPSGFFKLGEDDVIEKNDEFVPASASAMDVSSWCHRYPHIKKQGRCTVFVPEVPEGEDAPEPTEEESEVGPPLLAAITEDSPLGETPSWTAVTSSVVPGIKHTVSGFRSNLWPGAVAVTNGSLFINVYVGFGAKGTPYVPLHAPVPMKEYDADLVESNEIPDPPPEEPAEGEEEDAADEE